MGKVNNLRLTLSMDRGDELQQGDGALAVAEEKPKLKRPSQYQVVLLNDDYTPMDFVVHILQAFFNLEVESATRVMLAVHNKGKGVCGIYSKDVAETKAVQVNQYARESEHPLLCEIEAVDE
ncbi:ATP-dependent Clp protease adaptor protein ClpS [Sinobacterium caligoides]|uniref:ATP-dependent Clp protease adapter protein ClpS n=1 Tax=Sinobacterium caligoides TaxID=933926 RepID=A0A3N2DZ52_9GAMM|nr:ATP-dependent Clp protease adapter ClpS [Sinobacterium caligoides]ROS04565.1 ATP-dependent Clp protease adaptor protein ClpS [Sinobacterium caligoides]